jgi:hypothetical protein
MSPAWRRASWAIPPLFCVAFYWYGLKCWFRQDDFAWLGLGATVHNWADFWRAMFIPLAQGSIRPWSERAFFMGFGALFDLNAVPFRIFVFLTQVANLTLIRAVCQRITGSPAAGVWAALLWICNTALIAVMTWTSVYNEAMCGFFLLLAFYFLLRYIETGDKRFNRAQWLVFLLGFGALEINVVYPALAAAYTWLCARKYFPRTLFLFVPSAIFTLAHRSVAPAVDAPSYIMRFDATILNTFWKYFVWARGVNHFSGNPAPVWMWTAGTALILGSLAAFAVVKVRQGSKAPLFFAAWFLIILTPVLPLRYHLTEYYLMLPVIGFCMLGGWGLASAWRSPRMLWKIAATALLLIYLGPLPVIRSETKSRYLLTKKISRMVMGVEEARRLHPDQIILLAEVSDELFWNGILDSPFRLVGVTDVYLAPEEEARLTPHPDLGSISQFVLPASATLNALNSGKIVVYSAAGEKLKNITGVYGSTSQLHLQGETPRRVDVANDLLAYLLGSTWYPRDETHRWIPKRATLRLGGPKSAGQRLYITGYCPSGQLEKGALPLTVEVDGKALATVQIQRGTERFDFDFALPDGLVGKESVEIAVEAGRTYIPPGEDRELGLVFGAFEIR